MSAMFLLTSLNVGATANVVSKQAEEQTGMTGLFYGLYNSENFGPLIIESWAMLRWKPFEGLKIYGYRLWFWCQKDGFDHELWLTGGTVIDPGQGSLLLLTFPPYTENNPLEWNGYGPGYKLFTHQKYWIDPVQSITIDFPNVMYDGIDLGDYFHSMEL